MSSSCTRGSPIRCPPPTTRRARGWHWPAWPGWSRRPMPGSATDGVPLDALVTRMLARSPYDDRAIQVIGWDGNTAMSTGRVVLPPGLPTEEACGLVVEPRGEVVDVGRMCVAPGHQGLEHAALIGLMCRLYLVMREHGFRFACGMMSAPARAMMGLFGLQLELLGPERAYWNEPRVPVRFSLMSAARLMAGAERPGAG